MQVKEFLDDLLKSQELIPEETDALRDHKDEVTDFLRAEFGEVPKIKYAGSHAKGTMIRDNYDLDIVCYFPSGEESTVKEIRENVSAHLSDRYDIEEKTSAVRIRNLKESDAPVGYHIDVVPGKFIEGSQDVFIHVDSAEKERMQTNLKTHIDHVVTSGCVDVIRLAKLWVCRNNLVLKTFILEIFVIRSLENFENKSNLPAAFIEVLRALKDDFEFMRLEDPANTNNIVSDALSSTTRNIIPKEAAAALTRVEDSDDLKDWKAIFREDEKKENVFSRPTSIEQPARQWIA